MIYKIKGETKNIGLELSYETVKKIKEQFPKTKLVNWFFDKYLLDKPIWEDIEYEKLSIEDKVKLANDKNTPKELVKRIIEEDDMQLKIQLLMSSKSAMEHISTQ